MERFAIEVFASKIAPALTWVKREASATVLDRHGTCSGPTHDSKHGFLYRDQRKAGGFQANHG